MRAHCLRVSVWILVAALLPGVSTVSAQKGKKAASHPQLVAELHQTRMLLHQADHDYDGFRAKAVHELGKAMHELDPNHKHKLPPSPNPGNGEDQVKSDAQLAQASKQVQVMMNQLSTGVATPRTTAAMQHMQNAVAHLNTALKIK
jgi:hypothetical protein